MPELVKVEQKIMDFTLEIEQTKLIIRRFDETLAQKADRISIDQLYLHCDETFAEKSVQKENSEKVQEALEKFD